MGPIKTYCADRQSLMFIACMWGDATSDERYARCLFFLSDLIHPEPRTHELSVVHRVITMLLALPLSAHSSSSMSKASRNTMSASVATS